MNKVERVDFVEFEDAPTMVYITFHTDGEPKELFTVWEITEDEIKEWFGYRYGMEDFTVEVADEFINDDSILEDSEEYECGKEPIYGVWYAPLTMEQIERSLS